MQEIIFYNGFNLLVDILVGLVVGFFAYRAGIRTGYIQGYSDGENDYKVHAEHAADYWLNTREDA